MAAARIDELPGWAVALIDTARVAHLGLIDGDDRPRVMPVTFAIDRGSFWIAVDEDKPKRVEGRELARVRWLRRNPAAALTVDRYSDDWTRLAWVQALGEAAVLDSPDPGAAQALAMKYDQYARRAPAGPYIRLAPGRLLCWRAEGD